MNRNLERNAMKWMGIFVVALAASVILLSGKAGANTFEDESQASMARSFDLSAGVSSITYTEPHFMKEEGLFYGLNASYTERSPQHMMGALEGRFAIGQVDYSSNGTGTLDDIQDWTGEARVLGGYDFFALSETRLTPYIGLGYRYLSDQSGGMTSTTGASGYDRESNYVYLPIGLKTITKLGDDWTLGFTIEYDNLLWGKQKSHLEDVDPTVDPIENKQNGGYGLRGSMQITRTMTETVDLVFEPYFKYWNIDASDIKSITISGTPTGLAGQEPANHSTEYGMNLGLHF